jgi:FAD/FMN-containing dehydrogenase
MRNLIAELTVIAGSAHVLSEPDVVAGYATDWTRRYAGEASCVVRPGSTEEVAAVLRACAGHGVPVVPQGGNTGLVGGSVPPPADWPQTGGRAAPAAMATAPVIVSARRLAGLGPVDVAAGQVTAGAGATISAVAAHADTAGMRYGIDLASRDSATVGRTIATNAGGIRTIRYGPTRAQVAGVTAVLADGSVVSDLSGLTAGSTGYDLAQLLTGSEGTLAVITAARLRLHPAEPVGAVLLAPAAGMAQAVGLYGQIRAGVPGLICSWRSPAQDRPPEVPSICIGSWQLACLMTARSRPPNAAGPRCGLTGSG